MTKYGCTVAMTRAHSFALLLGASTLTLAAGATTYTAHYHTSLLEHKLAHVTDGVFAEGLYAQLQDEVQKFADWEAQSNGGFTHGKRQTFFTWLSADGRVSAAQGAAARQGGARSAIEQAVELLLQLDFPDPAERRAIAGAEWWVQRRRLGEDIGFHYDKDEASASLRGRLLCPAESTVTYMSDGGGPTFILNRTTPDGNGADPALPRLATAVYPRPNRHVVFRGNLFHGVAGKLARRASGGSSQGEEQGQEQRSRVTFLVNWWEFKPAAPNCVELPDSVFRQLGVAPLGGGGGTDAARRLAGAHRTVAAAVDAWAGAGVASAPGAGDGEEDHHSIAMRFNDHFHFRLPGGAAAPDRAPSGVLSLDWAAAEEAIGRELVWTNAAELDLEDEQLMERGVWGEPLPKVIAWQRAVAGGGGGGGGGGGSGGAEAAAARHRVELLRVALPLARRFQGRAVVLLADPAKTADVAEAFELDGARLAAGPVLGVHHTADGADDKYAMDAGIEFSVAEAAEWLQATLAKIAAAGGGADEL